MIRKIKRFFKKIYKILFFNSFKKEKFIIQEIDLDEYSRIFKNLDFLNLSHIQTPGYFLEDEKIIYLKVVFNHQLISIATIQKKLFLKFIYLLRLNNGPLIRSDFKGDKYAVLKSILQYSRKKYTRIISYAPSNIFNEEKNIKIFPTFKLNIAPWKTSIIRLSINENDLLKNLKSKWRNQLKKGLRFTSIKEVKDIEKFKKIYENYRSYALKQDFKPIDNKKCRNWFANSKVISSDIILKVYQAEVLGQKDRTIGSLGVLYFKDKAIYLFGYTNKIGKIYQANSALLWNAILESKKNGIKEFDLGGLNETTPVGIRKFKEGLNGASSGCIGEFIYLGIF